MLLRNWHQLPPWSRAHRPATVARRAAVKMAHQHLVPARAQAAAHAPSARARARGGNVASVETTGPTVDDAIDAALEKLDLDEDQVELEILAEGGDGQPARVKATPRSEVAAQVATVTAEAEAEVEWDDSL